MRSGRSIQPLQLTIVLAVVGGSCATAVAVGGVRGHAARIEQIKGSSLGTFIEVYENNLFLSPPNASVVGPSRRLGTSCHNGLVCQTSIITGDGCYCIDGMPAGSYSILVNQPDFFVRPKVVPNVQILNSQTIDVNVDLPIDYSTAFRTNTQWTTPDNTWYQTFIATGTSITGVSFVLAGKGGAVGAADVAVYRKDGADPNPTTWTLVTSPNGSNPTVLGANPQREPSIGLNTDNWVRWRSGEVPTVPGKQYAVGITGVGGSIQPYKRNKDSFSYVGGEAFDAAGNAQPYDLNYTVFSDNDGTVITVNKRTTGIGQLVEGNFSTAWGHTFIAQGTSLAAVDCFAAGANNRWDLDFVWRIRDGGPNGAQIGPGKITGGAFFGAGAGLHGVSYNPGEVPLVAGQTYFVEFEVFNPPPESNGFNPYVTNDPYAGGHGYRWSGAAWDAKPGTDISMTIIEYKPTGPLIDLSPNLIERQVDKGDNLPNDAFNVLNPGGANLNYTITDNAAWLSVNPTNGVVGPGQSAPISVMYDVAGLNKGLFTATVSIADAAAANSPQAVTVKVRVGTVKPDFDGDGDVDQTDFGMLQKCFSGAGEPQLDPACEGALLDGDEDVDQNDFGVFQGCYSGANVLADKTCDD